MAAGTALLLAITGLVTSVTGECVVESHRCSFPFSGSSPGEEHYSCQAAEGGGGNQSQHYCRAQVGDRHVSGACNSQCYDLDGVTPAVFEEEDPSAIFCKTEASPCIFPFSWEGATYTACTRDGSEFAWCALQVDSEGGLVGSRWGKCDLATCGDTEEAEQEAREARAVFSGRVAGLLLFSQQSALAPVRVDGRLGGLRDVALVTLKLSAADCATVAVSGGSLGGEEVLEVAANTSTVSLDKWGVSLHPGKQGVVGGSARLEAMECAESGCEVARAIACADIVAGNGRAVSVSTVLTIALVVFCVLLLALTVILVVCCIKRFCPRRKQPEEADSLGSIDDIFKAGRRQRSPLYDELSIPFIDASLPPTPKVGRSSNPLEILLGRIDGSRTSLNDTSKSGN